MDELTGEPLAAIEPRLGDQDRVSEIAERRRDRGAGHASAGNDDVELLARHGGLGLIEGRDARQLSRAEPIRIRTGEGIP